MKFNAVVGNPPYQGSNHQQIYPFFYTTAIKIGSLVSLIFPIGWQEPKNANNLNIMNSELIKRDHQIFKIDNRYRVFERVAIDWVNIIVWVKNYNNNLEGKQLIFENGDKPEIKLLLFDKNDVIKPDQLVKLSELVQENGVFLSFSNVISKRKPYGISTNVFSNLDKQNESKILKNRNKSTDIEIIGNRRQRGYVPINYKFSKTSKALFKYKIFVPYAWGAMNEKKFLGGSYSDILIGLPNQACTETYLETGCFETKDAAMYHAKYMMTKFFRALLYLNKYSRHSTTAWHAIPVQDYSEEWWSKSISEIDKELIIKYNIPQKIACFIEKYIQPRTEKNIK